VIRIRISRRVLRRAGAVASGLAFLALCYVLGSRLTPRDAAGHPLILSPSVYAAERYRQAVLRWLAELETVDRRLTHLLDQEGIADPSGLYALSWEAEAVVKMSAALAQDVAFIAPPSSLVGLAEQARTTAEAYLEATLAAARWVGAPEPETRRAALQALRKARGLQRVLRASRWIDGSRPSTP